MEKQEISGLSNGEPTTYNDVDFCSFYYKALKRLLNFERKTNVSYLFRYIELFNEYFDNTCQLKSSCTALTYEMRILKNSLFYRFIYVYKNASLFSSAVAFHFGHVCEQNPNIIEKLIKKKKVKICSLGGCSAPDVVAIITVLKSIAVKKDRELDFEVTIIDFSTEWKNTCSAILCCLEGFREASRNINFLQCNLANTKSWTPKTMKAIREADVLAMVNYASKFRNKRNIVEMICNMLHDQAILFTLDRPITRLIELYLRISDLCDFDLIRTELCDYHTLDIEAVKHLTDLYYEHFGWQPILQSNMAMDLFVSVWVKASSKTLTRHKVNLESIFQKIAEKFKPEEIFLSDVSWKKLFRTEKQEASWDKKVFKRLVKKERRKRNSIWKKFISEKIEVDSLQNQLLSLVQLLDDDGEEFSETNEELLNNYLIHKTQYTLMKKTAYFASLIQIINYYL